MWFHELFKLINVLLDYFCVYNYYSDVSESFGNIIEDANTSGSGNEDLLCHPYINLPGLFASFTLMFALIPLIINAFPMIAFVREEPKYKECWPLLVPVIIVSVILIPIYNLTKATLNNKVKVDVFDKQLSSNLIYLLQDLPQAIMQLYIITYWS